MNGSDELAIDIYKLLMEWMERRDSPTLRIPVSRMMDPRNYRIDADVAIGQMTCYLLEFVIGIDARGLHAVCTRKPEHRVYYSSNWRSYAELESILREENAR